MSVVVAFRVEFVCDDCRKVIVFTRSSIIEAETETRARGYIVDGNYVLCPSCRASR